MRKISSLLLCLILTLTITACNEKVTVSKGGSKSEDIISSEPEKTSDTSLQTEDTSSDNTSTENENSSSASNSKDESKINSVSSNASSKKPTSSNNTSSKTKKPTSSKQDTSSSNQSNPTNNNTSSKPANDKEEINFEDLVLGEDYDVFAHKGFYTGSAVVDGILYIGFRSPNQVIAYDTKNLQVVNVFDLLPQKTARAFEMRFLNNSFYVSYPDIHCIKVYSKDTFEEIKTISLPYEVASFCIDGDVIYYSGYFCQHNVYKTNTSTGETIKTKGTFYDCKLELNKEKGLLYVGESMVTASVLYYFKTSDLTSSSQYIYNGYGLTNKIRSLFFDGKNVFWCGRIFDGQNAKNMIKEYPGNGSCFINKKYLVTPTGIYLKETGELISELDNITYSIITPDETLILIYGQEYSYDDGSAVIIIPYTE